MEIIENRNSSAENIPMSVSWIFAVQILISITTYIWFQSFFVIFLLNVLSQLSSPSEHQQDPIVYL